jgi:uncharacterized delta-60 repeat protein
MKKTLLALLTLAFGLTSVLAQPIIAQQPASTNSNIRGSVSLVCMVTDVMRVRYQWSKDGVPMVDDVYISGSKSSTLTLSNVCYGDMGNYSVAIADAFGSVTSNVAALTVFDPFIRSMKPGTAIGWGSVSWFGVSPPNNLTNATALSVGEDYCLALKVDGTVVGWGNGNDFGAATPPPGLSNVVAIAAGMYHSLALKSDGTVIGWGENDYGQTTIPVGLSNVVAISAGTLSSFALTRDGLVWAWGSTAAATNMPAGLTNCIAIGAGGYQALAVKNDGSVVALDQSEVPQDLTNVVRVVTGQSYSAALKNDGNVVAWGQYTNLPNGLTNITALAGGQDAWHCLALRGDGFVLGWGNDLFGPLDGPAPYTNLTAIGAGYGKSFGITLEPVIITQPSSAYSGVEGSTLNLNVGVIGSVPWTYQWLCNGTNLVGQVYSNLVITNTRWVNSGIYSVLVSNQYGLVLSSKANVTIQGSPPNIINQPTNQTAFFGRDASFSVTVNGSTPLSYQWFLNNGTIAGATNSVLDLTNASTLNSGIYTCVITNMFGSITSSGAALTVVSDPTISIQPINQTNSAGTAATFSVGTIGSAPLNYQWFKDGIILNDNGNILGSTGAALILSNVFGGDAGNYFVIITNVFGALTSSVAHLTVVDPVILSQPVGRSLNIGQSMTLSVVTAGTAPLIYQWRQYGASLYGATNASLTMPSVQSTNAGNYDVVVSNVFGCVTSSVAVVMPWLDSYNPTANGYVDSIALQPDGKALVGGSFTQLGGAGRSCIGRVNTDGSIDTNFNPGANSAVYSLTVQPDGKILVGGQFSALGGQSRKQIGRLNADGTVDSTFNPGVSGTVQSIKIQADGRILVGGSFNTIGGVSLSNLCRLNGDGTVDTNFLPRASSTINSIELQSDGKIVVGGYFTTLGGQSRSCIGRLNADGSVDSTFNPGANAAVDSIVVQKDGKILVGGQFGVLGGQNRNYIGRLNADGTVDNVFNPAANGEVGTLSLQADGKILVGGNFSILGGQSRSFFGRLNPDGTCDSMFNPGFGSYIYALEVQEDGKILAGGNFTTLGGQSRPAIGRLSNTDPASDSLTYYGTNITWLRGGTLPEVWRTTFEQSSDGTNWTMLGPGTRITGGWGLTGVTVTNVNIRARGYSVGGDGWSSGVVETRLNSPMIVAQPYGCASAVGATATFNVGVVGSSPFAYQWYKDGTALNNGGNVTGSTSNVLSLGNVQLTDAANYYVVVSNSWGSVTSQVAQLTVTPPRLAVVTTNGTFGFKNQQFQFTLTGPLGSNVVILASPDLQTWTPLVTNPLVGGSLIFTDPLSTNYSHRFYRAALSP